MKLNRTVVSGEKIMWWKVEKRLNVCGSRIDSRLNVLTNETRVFVGYLSGICRVFVRFKSETLQQVVQTGAFLTVVVVLVVLVVYRYIMGCTYK